MFQIQLIQRIPLVLLVVTLTACSSAPPAPAPAASAGAVTIPTIPAPVAVSVDSKTSALLIVDINSVICAPNPACTASVPGIASLLKKARDAKVLVIYTGSPSFPSATILSDIAPQTGEPTVMAYSNKFIGSNLDDLLTQRNATTLVIVGTAANGGVLYTSFHASARGYTVVVAEDGISEAPAAFGGTPFAKVLARYQLLSQPGFPNPANKPLAPKAVTLSRSDLITFK